MFGRIGGQDLSASRVLMTLFSRAILCLEGNRPLTLAFGRIRSPSASIFAILPFKSRVLNALSNHRKNRRNPLTLNNQPSTLNH
jgi:hypothetical protein